MKKKILFVNDEMVVGGVSKVLNNLLKKIDLNKYDVDLLILHSHGEMLNDIPEGIRVIAGSTFFDVIDSNIHNLIKNKQWRLVLKKVKLFLSIKLGSITKEITKQRKIMGLDTYDVEIAFKEGFCSIFVASGNSINKINWIHADYKIMNYSKNYMRVMKKIFGSFNKHVAVSKTAARSFEEMFNIDEVLVIHNIIDVQSIKQKALEYVDFRDDYFTFISVGRLHPQKGYSRLMEVCKKLKSLSLEFKLYIIGDGEENEMLENLIKINNLNNCVFLLGNQSNPFKYLKQADCFVLSSVYEGLPTVVYESLILGIPVVSTMVAGIDEQLTADIGIIVENSIDGIMDGMQTIIRNQELVEKFKHNLQHYEYENEIIVQEVYELFEGNI